MADRGVLHSAARQTLLPLADVRRPSGGIDRPESVVAVSADGSKYVTAAWALPVSPVVYMRVAGKPEGHVPERDEANLVSGTVTAEMTQGYPTGRTPLSDPPAAASRAAHAQRHRRGVWRHDLASGPADLRRVGASATVRANRSDSGEGTDTRGQSDPGVRRLRRYLCDHGLGGTHARHAQRPSGLGRIGRVQRRRAACDRMELGQRAPGVRCRDRDVDCDAGGSRGRRHPGRVRSRRIADRVLVARRFRSGLERRRRRRASSPERPRRSGPFGRIQPGRPLRRVRRSGRDRAPLDRWRRRPRHTEGARRPGHGHRLFGRWSAARVGFPGQDGSTLGCGDSATGGRTARTRERRHGAGLQRGWTSFRFRIGGQHREGVGRASRPDRARGPGGGCESGQGRGRPPRRFRARRGRFGAGRRAAVVGPRLPGSIHHARLHALRPRADGCLRSHALQRRAES